MEETRPSRPRTTGCGSSGCTATCCSTRGRLDDADVRFGELEREGEGSGRGEWVARGLEYRGRTAWYRGELDAAAGLFERGLKRLPAGQDQIEADLHNDLGIVHYYRGRPDDAFAEHSAALDLRKRLGDRLGMAKSYTNIGNLLADFRDDLEGAEEHYRLALEMAEAVGDRQMQYSALFNLATIITDRGEWVHAIEMFRQGERLLEEIGWGHARYQNILRQAESEIALGRLDAALRHLQALPVARGESVLEPVNRVNTRSYLFDAYLRARAERIRGSLDRRGPAAGGRAESRRSDGGRAHARGTLARGAGALGRGGSGLRPGRRAGPEPEPCVRRRAGRSPSFPGHDVRGRPRRGQKRQSDPPAQRAATGRTGRRRPGP